MSRLNRYDSKQFKSATTELFDNIEFMVGNNYMIVALDDQTGPRYFNACRELDKKPSEVVQAFIEVKTPQYEVRALTLEQEEEAEKRMAKFDLLHPADETKPINRFDQSQLKKVSEDFIQNLEIMFGEKFLLVRLESPMKERFYQACERLGKNPYTVVQQLIASKVIQYEEQAKQKKLQKEREERQASLEMFQQSIKETKNMVQANEKKQAKLKTQSATINLKEKL